jgi:hypothetical protein
VIDLSRSELQNTSFALSPQTVAGARPDQGD